MKYTGRALAYLRAYGGVAAGALLSMLLVNAANLLAPQVLRYLIDEGIQKLNMDAVWLAVASIGGIALVRGLFNFLQGYWSEVASQGVAFDLRNEIFEKLQNLSFSYHDKSQTGKLMTRMTSDVELVRSFVGRGFLMMISSIFMMLGTTVVLFIMNWKLAMVVIGVIPVLFLIFFLLITRVFPISKGVQEKLGQLNTILQENLAGFRVVKAFAREDYEISRYAAKNEELLNENLKFVGLFTTYFPLVFFVANLGLVGVIWVGGLQVMDAVLSIGELFAFINYFNYLLMPFFMIGMVSATLGQAEASAQRLFEVTDAESEVQERAGAIELANVRGNVVFDDVRFKYIGAESEVISGVSFEASAGETIAILGQTGAGKSTIINLIPRFYDVTEGKVLIDGHDVRDLTLDSLRSQIGIVLQETTLFSGTIRENIAYGRPDATDDEIRAVAIAAQAHDFIAKLDGGYDAQVGERGVGLSGGQKQRVAIARALLVDPKILILDDSTSSVDAETEYKIQEALDELMLGRTSFVIAQRISTVRSADQILLLDSGKLVSSGSHQELMETSELYWEILSTQFGERADQIFASKQEVSS